MALRRAGRRVKGLVHWREDAEYALSAGIADEIAAGEGDFGDCDSRTICTPLSPVREQADKYAAR